MNVEHTLRGIDFEWDSEKAANNLSKHGVSFESACEVFFDPMFFAIDEEVIDDELREHLIGMTRNWRLLYVIYMMRDDIVRIISARAVEPLERRHYENQ